MTSELSYPIGKFKLEGEITPDLRGAWIADLLALPDQLTEAVSGLTEEQLDAPYRPEGWSSRQVVHHIADSHMNSYIRFKLALTEDQPTIKPYEEQLWADLGDTFNTPIALSITLTRALHERWANLIRTMSDEQFAREFVHPASKRAYRLDFTLGVYAWHGRHHLAHITSLRERMGW